MRRPGYANLRKGRASITGQIYHIVSSTYQRQPVFGDWNNATLACATFTSNKVMRDSSLLAWVLMPDHVHWLLQLGEEDEITRLIQRMKSLSARAIRGNGYTRRVWNKGFFDRAIRKDDDIAAVARYIVANPLRAGLCENVRYYPYWDAIYL